MWRPMTPVGLRLSIVCLAAIMTRILADVSSYLDLIELCCSPSTITSTSTSTRTMCTFDDLVDYNRNRSITAVNTHIRTDNNDNNGQSSIASSLITMVSYCTEDILDFARPAYTVNSAFAKHRGYALQLHSSMDGPVFEPRDHRWNRVKLIESLLLDSSKSGEYYVWFDADLIFIDFDFQFETLIRQNPRADIIISAERHAETGVANTGCFIVKNTRWSQWFMSQWWSNFDRSLNHDQVFFDVLYKSLPASEVLEHIAILPANILNSIPPAMFFQASDDAVLHLMGWPRALRAKVFSEAVEEICNAGDADGPISLKSQLGLTLSVLQNIAQNYYRNSITQSLPQIIALASSVSSSMLLAPAVTTTILVLEQVHQLLQQVSSVREDALQLRAIRHWQHSTEPYHSPLSVFLLLRFAVTSVVRAIVSLNSNIVIAVDHTKTLRQWMVDFLNLEAVLGNDIISEMATSDGDDFIRTTLARSHFLNDDITSRLIVAYKDTTKLSLFKAIEDSLNELIALLAAPSSIAIKEQLALHYHNTGLFYYSISDANQAIRYLNQSTSLFRNLSIDGGNMYHAIQPLMSLGQVYCESNMAPEGLSTIAELLSLLDTTLLFAEKQVSAEYINLARAYVQVSKCILGSRHAAKGEHDGPKGHTIAESFLRRGDLVLKLLMRTVDHSSIMEITKNIEELSNAIDCPSWPNAQQKQQFSVHDLTALRNDARHELNKFLGKSPFHTASIREMETKRIVFKRKKRNL